MSKQYSIGAGESGRGPYKMKSIKITRLTTPLGYSGRDYIDKYRVGTPTMRLCWGFIRLIDTLHNHALHLLPYEWTVLRNSSRGSFPKDNMSSEIEGCNCCTEEKARHLFYVDY